MKTFFYLLPLLFITIIFSSCTSQSQTLIKETKTGFEFKITLKSPTKKPVPNCKFKIRYVENGKIEEVGEFITDNNGTKIINVTSSQFKGELFIDFPVQDFQDSVNFKLPYEYHIKNKKYYEILIYIPYTPEFLETKDSFTRKLLIRRVLLNIHTEWDKETIKMVNSGNITEGMESDMVRAALGDPQNITKYYSGEIDEIWSYFISPSKTVKVYIRNGEVTEIEKEYRPQEDYIPDNNL